MSNWNKAATDLVLRNVSSAINFSQSSVHKTEIKMEEKKQTKSKKKTRTAKKPSLQETTKKKVLAAPTIILSYKDPKSGKDISKVYTCKDIRLTENRETTLSGDEKVSRKDIVDIVIEASVIDID